MTASRPPARAGSAGEAAPSGHDARGAARLGAIRVVHEGRGGYVEVGGRRYPIEHVEGGRFAIHFPAGHRHAGRARDLSQLEALVRADPARWGIENRARGCRPATSGGRPPGRGKGGPSGPGRRGRSRRCSS